MRDRLDDLLDDALADYVAEPRRGLEYRVLHRVRSAGKRPRFAIPAFAFVLMAYFAVITRQEKAPIAIVAIPTEVKSGTQPVAKPVIRRQRRVSLPKKEVFPSPTGLTDGERALLALVKHHPETAFEVGKTNLELIEIQPLEIRPLQTERGQ